jgi:hypothetical protein
MQTFNYVITVDFKSGTPLTGSVTADIDCGLPTGGQSFTLSSGNGATDFSYRDLDAGASYKQADATGARIKEIDIVALYSSSATNKIFTPFAVSLFYTGTTYNGEDVHIWKVPSSLQSSAASAILVANDVTGLTTFMGQASQVITTANHLGPNDGLDIANNVPFVIESTEGDLFVGLIVASSLTSTPKTVTVKVIPAGYIYYDGTYTICPDPTVDCDE